jgi:hypothetical protein
MFSMCILIASTDGELPTIAELYACEDSNPHGIGIAWSDGDALTIRKAMNLTEFLPMLADKPDESPYVLHFRFATHGETNLENCHPFKLGNHTAMAHNGILPWRSTQSRSDTRCFVRDILRPNRREVWDSSFQEHIENFIGEHNKLAFIDRFGQVAIYNEHMGHWRGNIWFSNCSYRSYRYLTDKELADDSEQYDEINTDDEWSYTDSIFRGYYDRKRGE